MADGRLLRPLYMGHVRLWEACPICPALQRSVAALGVGGMTRGGSRTREMHDGRLLRPLNVGPRRVQGTGPMTFGLQRRAVGTGIEKTGTLGRFRFHEYRASRVFKEPSARLMGSIE